MIASGNHLLTQVKDNQPKLRRRLELGSMGRKPSGSATSKSKGRNRWETRKLMVFPAKAWFRATPWESLIKTVLRLERSVWKRDAKTGLLHHTCETVFWVSSLSGPTAEKWNEHIRRHWRIENGSHEALGIILSHHTGHGSCHGLAVYLMISGAKPAPGQLDARDAWRLVMASQTFSPLAMCSRARWHGR